MHLASASSGNETSAINSTNLILENPLLPIYDNVGVSWFDGSEGLRRQYWQALLLLSVGLSLLLGAFVFLGLTMRRCPAMAAGAAAASLSSVALVALLVSAKAGDNPKYE